VPAFVSQEHPELLTEKPSHNQSFASRNNKNNKASVSFQPTIPQFGLFGMVSPQSFLHPGETLSDLWEVDLRVVR
jgi:hypothetical protein